MVLKAVLLAVFCSFLSLITHLAVSCFKKIRSTEEQLIFELTRQAKLISAIWISAFLIYVLLFFMTPEIITTAVNKLNDSWLIIGFGYGIIIYLFLSFMYLTIYYLVDRSVSATLLEIIDNAALKKLTIDEVKRIYDVDKKYQSELKGMLDGGFIITEADYYKNSLKGRLYALAAKFIKGILKLGPGG